MPKRAPTEPLTLRTETVRRCYATDGVCWVECILMLPRVTGGGRGGARMAAFYLREEKELYAWCARLAEDERAAYEADGDPRKRYVHRCRRYRMSCETQLCDTCLTVRRVVTLSHPADRPARAELCECWKLPEGLLLPPKKEKKRQSR